MFVVFAMVCKDAIATCGPGAKRACDVALSHFAPMDLPIVAPRKRSPPISWPTPENKSRKAAYLKKNDRLARTAVPKSWSQKQYRDILYTSLEHFPMNDCNFP
ncbi:hypothetical protein PSTT_01813 [Puccinia striiformis]|uniref:Uncharacterized protein n=1 Tax=Puccinia striiformis TaxID=27350 RepID=A0A2S4W2A2_9BASI|nr:hypothetical protein PSTT_01813 [Puccinia striiformis]